MADTSKFLPKLLGPVVLEDNGTPVNAAANINFIGATIAYDAPTDTLDIDVSGGGAVNLATGVTGTLPVANGGTGVTTSTGSGATVRGTSPTLTTPQIDGGRAELDSFRVKGSVTNASTTTVNDITRAAIIRLTGVGINITGIDATGAEDGEVCEFWSLTTGQAVQHESVSSTAANRIITHTATGVNLYPGCVHQLRYDATALRWRFVVQPY